MSFSLVQFPPWSLIGASAEDIGFGSPWSLIGASAKDVGIGLLAVAQWVFCISIPWSLLGASAEDIGIGLRATCCSTAGCMSISLNSLHGYPADTLMGEERKNIYTRSGSLATCWYPAYLQV